MAGDGDGQDESARPSLSIEILSPPKVHLKRKQDQEDQDLDGEEMPAAKKDSRKRTTATDESPSKKLKEPKRAAESSDTSRKTKQPTLGHFIPDAAKVKKSTAAAPKKTVSRSKKDGLAPIDHVALVGFSEKEVADWKEKLGNGLFEISTGHVSIAHTLNCVVLNSTGSTKLLRDWNALFLGAFHGCNFAEVSFLEECAKKQEVADLLPHQLLRENLGIRLSAAPKTLPEGCTLDAKRGAQLAFKLQDLQAQKPYFCDPVFERLLFVHGTRRTDVARVQELCRILQASNRKITREEGGNWIKMRHEPKNADRLASMVVLVFHDEPSREEKAPADAIKRLLIKRVPVLNEELLHQLIMQLERPTKENCLLLSYQHWNEKCRWDDTEKLFNWVTGTDDAMPEELDAFLEKTKPRKEPAISRCRAAMTPMDRTISQDTDISMRTSTDDAEDLHMEFEEEVRLNDMEGRSERPDSPERQPQTITFAPAPKQPMVRCDNGMQVFNFDLEDTLPLPAPQLCRDWVDMVPLIANAYNRIPRGRKLRIAPANELAYDRDFERMATLNPKFYPSMLMHFFDKFLYASSGDQVPDPHRIAKVVHEILINEKFEHHAECTQPIHAFLGTLSRILGKCPPVDASSRYYWLSVFSEVKLDSLGVDEATRLEKPADKSQRATDILLNKRDDFRKLLVDVFCTATACYPELQLILVELLEWDLYACEIRVCEPETQSLKIDYPAALHKIPLAYLLLNGTDVECIRIKDSEQLLTELCQKWGSFEEAHDRIVTARLITVLMASARCMVDRQNSSQVHIGDLPRDFHESVSDLGQPLRNNKQRHKQPAVNEHFPLEWLVKALNDYSHRTGAYLNQKH